MIIRKKYLFYTLAIISSFIAALTTSVDTIISNSYIKNPWAFGFSLFFVGSIITLLITLVFSIPIKKRSIGAKILDPSFKRIRLVQKKELKYHSIAGLMNAINTIGYCALLSIVLEPSVVLSFSQVVIVYLLLMESITEKDVPTLVEVQSLVIVTFGAILASISLTGEINLMSILIVFVVISPTWAIFSIYQRRLKIMKINNKPNDSLNIRFWNVLFSLFFITLFLIGYDVFFGSQYTLLGVVASIQYFWWIALTMGITFFAYVLYIRSLGLGKASINNAIRASTIIFALPLSFILTTYFGLPMFSTDPVMLIIKVIGMILIVLGIISFALALVKAYVFITVKPGYPLRETMKKLWDIRGVTHVTITAGRYDFIVKVSTRTLMKGYEKIIRKLEEIPEIQKHHWASVLKDWENI
ncbi:MAG: Lrp/AsnC ligand binding domain-containing protein [Methanobacteriota archaeon]